VDVQVRLLLILAALAAPQTTVDRTLSCQVVQEGEAFVFSLQASVTTPRTGAYLKFWPTPLSFDEPAVQPGLDVDTHPGTITWAPPRSRCEPAKTIPLSHRGLEQDVVVTTHFVGSTYVVCHAAPHIRFRARISVAHGEATHAQLVAVADNPSKPILYTDWTPSRIAVWIRPRCTD